MIKREREKIERKCRILVGFPELVQSKKLYITGGKNGLEKGIQKMGNSHFT